MAMLLIDFMDVVGFMENDIPDKISQYIYPGKLELLQRIRPLAQKMEEHERGMYISNLAFMMSEVSCKYNADLSKDDGKRALDEILQVLFIETSPLLYKDLIDNDELPDKDVEFIKELFQIIINPIFDIRKEDIDNLLRSCTVYLENEIFDIHHSIEDSEERMIFSRVYKHRVNREKIDYFWNEIKRNIINVIEEDFSKNIMDAIIIAREKSFIPSKQFCEDIHVDNCFKFVMEIAKVKAACIINDVSYTYGFMTNLYPCNK